jgi:hypothetical protein
MPFFPFHQYYSNLLDYSCSPQGINAGNSVTWWISPRAGPSRMRWAFRLIFDLGILLAMLPTRSFARAAHRALSHPQVSVFLSMYLCLLIFCRLFDSTRRGHPLRLLVGRKEAMYAFEHPCMP